VREILADFQIFLPMYSEVNRKLCNC